MISFSPGYWEAIALTATLNAIVSLGLFATLLSGQISVAHAALLGAGAYLSAILTTYFDWPFAPSILAGVLLAAGLGTLIAISTTRMSGLVQSLVTLAFGEALAVVAYNVDYIGGASSFTGIPLYTTIWVALLGLAIALYAVGSFDRSASGLAARAVRDNPVAAEAAGVNVVSVRVRSYALGGALAGLAGALTAHYVLVVNPDNLTFFESFSILVFVLFGGSYVILGPVLGAVILTVLPELFRSTITFRFALYGLVATAIVIWRPEGLLTRQATSLAARRSASMRRQVVKVLLGALGLRHGRRD